MLPQSLTRFCLRDTQTAAQIKRDRNASFQEYLDASNQRALFANVVTEEYNPFSMS